MDLFEHGTISASELPIVLKLDWLAGGSAAATAGESLPPLERPASANDSDGSHAPTPQDAVAGVTAAGLTGPSGKKWLAAGEDEPEVSQGKCGRSLCKQCWLEKLEFQACSHFKILADIQCGRSSATCFLFDCHVL